MPYKYIGRTTDFKGKTLWEILGNLKNFGIERTIGRNRFQRYSEPCYIKVMKVEVLQNCKPSYDEQRKAIVLVENIFRGLKNIEFVQMESATYKADYFLVHRNIENQYNTTVTAPVRIFPCTMGLPPLMSEIVLKDMAKSGRSDSKEPKMKVIYNQTGFNKRYQVAEEGELPTESELTISLGKPLTPRLYETIKL